MDSFDLMAIGLTLAFLNMCLLYGLFMDRAIRINKVYKRMYDLGSHWNIVQMRKLLLAGKDIGLHNTEDIFELISETINGFWRTFFSRKPLTTKGQLPDWLYEELTKGVNKSKIIDNGGN